MYLFLAACQRRETKWIYFVEVEVVFGIISRILWLHYTIFHLDIYSVGINLENVVSDGKIYVINYCNFYWGTLWSKSFSVAEALLLRFEDTILV